MRIIGRLKKKKLLVDLGGRVTGAGYAIFLFPFCAPPHPRNSKTHQPPWLLAVVAVQHDSVGEAAMLLERCSAVKRELVTAVNQRKGDAALAKALDKAKNIEVRPAPSPSSCATSSAPCLVVLLAS